MPPVPSSKSHSRTSSASTSASTSSAPSSSSSDSSSENLMDDYFVYVPKIFGFRIYRGGVPGVPAPRGIQDMRWLRWKENLHIEGLKEPIRWRLTQREIEMAESGVVGQREDQELCATSVGGIGHDDGGYTLDSDDNRLKQSDISPIMTTPSHSIGGEMDSYGRSVERTSSVDLDREMHVVLDGIRNGARMEELDQEIIHTSRPSQPNQSHHHHHRRHHHHFTDSSHTNPHPSSHHTSNDTFNFNNNFNNNDNDDNSNIGEEEGTQDDDYSKGSMEGISIGWQGG